MDVIRDTYRQCRDIVEIDMIVDLDITSPIRRLRDVERAIEEYCSSTQYDMVFSVVEARRNPYFNMVQYG